MTNDSRLIKWHQKRKEIMNVYRLYLEITDRIFDGEKYPQGRSITAKTEQEDKEKKEFALPKIIELYQEVKKDGNDKLLRQTYYLARALQAKDSDKLNEIKKEGASYHLDPSFTEEERVKAGLLFAVSFKKGKVVFAASIPDQRRGCSSSACSNCAEPIAYCHVRCKTCLHPLIGPHGYPCQYEEFLFFTKESRIFLHESAWRKMETEICRSNYQRTWNDDRGELKDLYEIMRPYRC